MSANQSKDTKRGFVMTGGGAKGLYEAGVIHAFHLCGIEFDVITGSSIGAINAIFFGEYLYRKQQLPAEVRKDPEQVVDAMDPMVKAFQHAWWRLPEAQIVDDSEEGPLGRLKDDLARADIDLPSLVRLGWWWTDPNRWQVPPPRVWPHMLKLGRELVERLGDGSTLFKVMGREKHSPVEAALRAYLGRFDLEQSLVPPKPNILREYFSKPVSPMRIDHILDPDRRPQDEEKVVLIDPSRTMRDYRDNGIDVRLTRANYRTGRLELSAYTRLDEFIRFLEGRDPTKRIVIGSTRVIVPGNPNAINAAVASGRFPGVFAPFPVTDIYPYPNDPQSEPENALLYKVLEDGLQGDVVRDLLFEEYRQMNREMPQEEARYVWDRLYPLWTSVPVPRHSDAYIDGGAIDNTPTNSAVDAIREEIDHKEKSRRNTVLDLYVVFLHSEPNPGVVHTYDDPALYQVVARTLKIQGAAKMTSDAGVVKTINRFGNDAEELGQQVHILLESVEEGLQALEEALPDTMGDEEKRTVLQDFRRRLADSLLEQAEAGSFSDLQGESLETLLGQMKRRHEEIVQRRLPLHVTPIEIYPDEMQLDTLQFTERLGFRRQNAVEAMTMGCYNTLWRLRNHLEEKEKLAPLDDVDRRALALLRRWMGFQEWPRSEKERESLHQKWPCQRTACVFHTMHCRHGRRLKRVVEVNVSPPGSGGHEA